MKAEFPTIIYASNLIKSLLCLYLYPKSKFRVRLIKFDSALTLTFYYSIHSYLLPLLLLFSPFFFWTTLPAYWTLNIVIMLNILALAQLVAGGYVILWTTHRSDLKFLFLLDLIWSRRVYYASEWYCIGFYAIIYASNLVKSLLCLLLDPTFKFGVRFKSDDALPSTLFNPKTSNYQLCRCWILSQYCNLYINSFKACVKECGPCEIANNLLIDIIKWTMWNLPSNF
jgi:hypothetical protein